MTLPVVAQHDAQKMINGKCVNINLNFKFCGKFILPEVGDGSKESDSKRT